MIPKAKGMKLVFWTEILEKETWPTANQSGQRVTRTAYLFLVFISRLSRSSRNASLTSILSSHWLGAAANQNQQRILAGTDARGCGRLAASRFGVRSVAKIQTHTQHVTQFVPACEQNLSLIIHTDSRVRRWAAAAAAARRQARRDAR